MLGAWMQADEPGRARRRIVRALAGVGLVVAAVAACAPTSARAMRTATAAFGPPPFYATTTAHAAPGRPNIVFVLTDDLSDNLVAQMPEVQSLKQQGTSFKHYYVVDSLCCPSRAAIFTGEYPHDDGVFTNTGKDGGYHAFQAHHDQRRSFVRDLRGAGYTTAFMGKYLNRYRVFDSVPPGWDVWDGVNGQGYAEYNYGVNVNGVEADYADAPADYLTSVLSGKATSFIKYAARRSHPFFLEVATFAPHAPFVPAPQYAGTAQDLPYPATPAYDAQVRNPPPWLHQRQPLKPAAQATMLRNYQLRVEDDYSVDDLISNIEAELQAAGVANNTYIVFSSDNGYHMGEYRLLMGKQTAFDTDINVPLVVVGPHVPAGATVSALASSVDLAPTFEQLAGARIGAGVDGVSLLPLLSGHVPRDWQQAVLVEHHKPPYSSSDPDAQTKAEANPPSYEAVRTLRGLLVRYVGGAEEYYDTRTDPYELDNLGGGRAPLPMKRALHQLRYCHGATACQRAATAPFRVRSR